MFVWECIKSEGTHVGVCVDSFMFGTCCVHNATVNTVISNHQQHNRTSTFKPSSLQSGSVGNESIKLASTSLTSSFAWTASSTTKPSHYYHHHQVSSASHSASTRPMKPFSHVIARPLQKRPHAKPTSVHDINRLQTLAMSSASPANTLAGNRPQETKKPNHHGDYLHHQKIRPNEGSTNERPIFVQSQPGFKDKLETHNTLIVRLPGKEHASTEDEIAVSSENKAKPSKPNKPSNQRPFESRPDDSKIENADLSVQETIIRPNLNSIVKNVSCWSFCV